ncbi:hypothetical protein BP00DRAFT_30433 [Aspergillus indologenus CBS 114.80]|uniref:Secreted protein n=1 Tax=Aspergillus indologenus CBS 114.80 TaxID=1450541 RepID=A0A2V5I017_9EURO|nr:hypothetical protein BP00DRAFT_30433 [Aspergillus indologenus CBS 114.80]
MTFGLLPLGCCCVTFTPSFPLFPLLCLFSDMRDFPSSVKHFCSMLAAGQGSNRHPELTLLTMEASQSSAKLTQSGFIESCTVPELQHETGNNV